MLRSMMIKTATVGLVVALASAAGANITVYNNFGPDNDGWDYNWGLGWTVAGDGLDQQFGVEQAFLFTPSESGPVSDIWVAMWRVPFVPGPHEVVYRLAHNTNDAFPEMGDVMQEWTLDQFEPWTDWSPPHHLEGDGTSYLQAGQSYWLWAQATLETTWTGWCMNVDPSLTLPHTLRRDGEDWLPIGNDTASAFRVDVIPAPGSIGVLALAGLAGLRRRR